MTEQRNVMGELISACWKEELLKKRLMSDPKTVLAEYGIDVPDHIKVQVLENTDNTVHITLPKKPDELVSLSDDELASAAGGAFNWGFDGGNVGDMPHS